MLNLEYGKVSLKSIPGQLAQTADLTLVQF